MGKYEIQWKCGNLGPEERVQKVQDALEISGNKQNRQLTTNNMEVQRPQTKRTLDMSVWKSLQIEKQKNKKIRRFRNEEI